MKRRWDIIKAILEQIEADSLIDFFQNEDFEKGNPNCSKAELLGHFELLISAGLVVGAVVKRDSTGGFAFWDFRGAHMTMAGYDLLEALRNKEIWNRIKRMAERSGISLSWEFVKAAIPFVLKTIIEQNIC